jgi:hypothetical protein
LNARMPPPAVAENDLRTSLTLVVDLGTPSVGDAGGYFIALHHVWVFCVETSGLDQSSPPGGEFHPPSSLSEREGMLRVESMRLASPLEAVLTAASSTYAPIAYGVAGMAILERAVRLLMAWQVHRRELRRPEAEASEFEAADILVESATGVDGLSIPSAAALVPRRHQQVVDSVRRLSKYRIISIQGDEAPE